LQTQGSSGHLNGFQPVIVCPGLQAPITQ